MSFITLRRLPARLAAIHMSMARSPAGPDQQGLECLAPTLGDDTDRTVGQVPHAADDTDRDGLLTRVPSKGDALHSAGHPDLESLAQTALPVAPLVATRPLWSIIPDGQTICQRDRARNVYLSYQAKAPRGALERSKDVTFLH